MFQSVSAVRINITMFLALLALSVLAARAEQLIFNEEFDHLNFDVWEHEITLGGGGK